LEHSEAMTAPEVRRFIEGRTLLAIDPATDELIATVDYNSDRTCVARFPDGEKDTGQYGFVENRYWTRYSRFRQGMRNEFFLVPSGADRAQAYYADGRPAFLQIYRAD
jgi:hypothetical protein